MKAVVLCAGFGRRLNPLTHSLPKPLIPFFGLPMLELITHKIRQAGFSEIAINTHFQAEMIHEFLKTEHMKDIFISHEKEILGTAGVYRGLTNWRQKSDLLVINCDILSDFPIQELIAHYKEHPNLATMGLIPRREGKTPIVYDGNRILSIGEAQNLRSPLFSFSGYQILSHSFLEQIEKSNERDLIFYYQKALTEQKQPILGFCHTPLLWEDIGDIKDYWQAHLRFVDLLPKLLHTDTLKNFGIPKHLLEPLMLTQLRVSKHKQPDQTKIKLEHTKSKNQEYPGVTIIPPCFIGHDMDLKEGCEIGPFAFLYGKGSVGKHSTVRNSVLMQKTTDSPVVLQNQISGPNFDIFL